MKFYQDANGLFVLDDNIAPPRSAILESFENDTIVKFKTLEGEYLTEAIEVTNVKKADGSSYADLAEILSANTDFFN